MVHILSNLKFNTHNISGYLADYFVKHYNKYKALLSTENINYLEDIKRLNNLATKYRIETQKSVDLALERTKLEAIVKKMRESYLLTVEQQNEFDLLVKDIFDNKKC
jgi:hydroxylamine reductase (hybrid-cluster protein)